MKENSILHENWNYYDIWGTYNKENGGVLGVLSSETNWIV